MNPESDPLSELLRRHDAPPLPPSHLERSILQRIAARPARPPRLIDRLDAIFAQPSFAAVFVVGCVLLGLFTAEVRIVHTQAERNARLERSYLELIDPLINPSK